MGEAKTSKELSLQIEIGVDILVLLTFLGHVVYLHYSSTFERYKLKLFRARWYSFCIVDSLMKPK